MSLDIDIFLSTSKRKYTSLFFQNLPLNRVICGFTHFHCSFFSVAGISGSSKTGCNSLVLAGGYEEDKDHGYEFTYSGKTIVHKEMIKNT